MGSKHSIVLVTYGNKEGGHCFQNIKNSGHRAKVDSIISARDLFCTLARNPKQMCSWRKFLLPVCVHWRIAKPTLFCTPGYRTTLLMWVAGEWGGGWVGGAILLGPGEDEPFPPSSSSIQETGGLGLLAWQAEVSLDRSLRGCLDRLNWGSLPGWGAGSRRCGCWGLVPPVLRQAPPVTVAGVRWRAGAGVGGGCPSIE